MLSVVGALRHIGLSGEGAPVSSKLLMIDVWSLQCRVLESVLNAVDVLNVDQWEQLPILQRLLGSSEEVCLGARRVVGLVRRKVVGVFWMGETPQATPREFL
jgi:hypothetical protein